MIITDEAIISEAIRLVSEGVSVTLPVNGRSMLPFIIGGEESVILQKPGIPAVGQVVLAWVEGSRYVVHRIIAINSDQVILMGDGNLRGTEHCHKADIKALATHVTSADGHKHDLYIWRRKLSVWMWYRLCPIRRYLLAAYSRIRVH